MKNITLSEEYDRFWDKIINNENFALIRSQDGEYGIICGDSFSAQEGWKAPKGISDLGKDIDANFDMEDDNFYFGISCPDCNMEGYLWYINRIKNKKNITFGNIWVNINYKRFKNDFFALKRDAVVIANYRAKGKPIGNLNIKKYYSITDDCFSFWGEDSEKMIDEIISDFGSQNNLLYVVSAGPMAGPIIERLFKNNPNNCYIDFGSSIDGFYRKVTTRPYMIPGTLYAERDCWMYNPSENIVIEQIIPKTIHYCWFGRGKKSPLMKKCIKSWRKYCPDYKIIEWNEDNFNVNQNIWTKQAYEAEKWAFVADYVKLWVLYNYGGVYMDTDVELIKPLDRFLIHEAFSGMESHRVIPTGIIGSVKKQEMIKEFLDWYNDRPFKNNDIEWHAPNTVFMTELVKQYGGLTPAIGNYYQTIRGLALYPKTYFCPLSINEISNCKSRYTYAIHHFASSWRTSEEIDEFKKAKRAQVIYSIKTSPQRFIRAVVGDDTVNRIKSKIKDGK